MIRRKSKLAANQDVRDAILGLYNKGYSLGEIATIGKVSQSWVKRRLQEDIRWTPRARLIRRNRKD